MATEIKLPRLGQGMESGTIVKWLKSEGDAVEKGEPLYELDTDKVTEDVERAAAAPAPTAAVAEAPGEVEVVELSSLRRTVARRMTEAWQAPAFQISMSADMTRALAVRARLVELRADGAKPTISDLLTKVAAAALMRHREVNAHFAGDSVRLMPSADIGIAVATERGL